MGNNCNVLGCTENVENDNIPHMNGYDLTATKSSIRTENGVKTKICLLEQKNLQNIENYERSNVKGNRMLMYVKEIPTKIYHDKIKENFKKDPGLVYPFRNNKFQEDFPSTNKSNEYNMNFEEKEDNRVFSKSVAGKFNNFGKDNLIDNYKISKKNIGIDNEDCLTSQNKNKNGMNDNNVYRNGFFTNKSNFFDINSQPLKRENLISNSKHVEENNLYKSDGFRNNKNSYGVNADIRRNYTSNFELKDQEIKFNDPVIAEEISNNKLFYHSETLKELKNKINTKKTNRNLAKDLKKGDIIKNIKNSNLNSPKNHLDREQLENLNKKLNYNSPEKGQDNTNGIKPKKTNMTIQILKIEKKPTKKSTNKSIDNFDESMNTSIKFKKNFVEKPDDILMSCGNSLLEDDPDKSVYNIELIKNPNSKKQKKIFLDDYVENKHKENSNIGKNTEFHNANINIPSNKISHRSNTAKSNKFAINFNSKNLNSIKYSNTSNKLVNKTNDSNPFKNAHFSDAEGKKINVSNSSNNNRLLGIPEGKGRSSSFTKKIEEKLNRKSTWKINPTIFEDQKLMDFINDPFLNHYSSNIQ